MFCARTPLPQQFKAVATPHVVRRSSRLVKKNKGCTILVAKRAEIRLAEAFGELPNGKENEDDLEESAKQRMKAYLEMCKKPLTPKAIEAIRVLAGISGKAQVDLAALGFTCDDLSTLSQEVNV